MTQKIIYYQNLFLLHFAISEFMERNFDCEQYALIDTTNRPKKFFQSQKLVDFKKQWFFHDNIQVKSSSPDVEYLKKFEKQERKERKLSNTLLDDIKKFPKKAHPMDVARTTVSIMGLEDKETKDNSPESNMRKVMRIFAKTPVALAAFYRSRKGKKIISPKKNLSFSENFFYMCFGKVPDKEIVKAFDVSLIFSY